VVVPNARTDARAEHIALNAGRINQMMEETLSRRRAGRGVRRRGWINDAALYAPPHKSSTRH
jgi:hypothetical protein